MPTAADLLAGIAAHPAESDRWLVLADWYEDQGDPRAELARLRFRLRVYPDHPEVSLWLDRQKVLLASGLAPATVWGNELGMRFAVLEPGRFLMGSPDSEPKRYGDETQHSVVLSTGYALGVVPVTVGQFQRFVAATNHVTDAERARDRSTWRSPQQAPERECPVVSVSWNDAQALVGWLNEREAASCWRYALPTEAQWEYACRAGSQTAYFWGQEAAPAGEYAWCASSHTIENQASSPRERPANLSVRTKRPNVWGLAHMAGLVWEWCQDWYGPYNAAEESDPSGPPLGTERVLRGGSNFSNVRFCRSARRHSCAPDLGSEEYGIRLAAVLRE